jgi:hypothetical protein
LADGFYWHHLFPTFSPASGEEGDLTLPARAEFAYM